tara:strand:+ start:499 stop:870 length:372 start_codon:yes stop_codon:yes gene_type:complete
MTDTRTLKAIIEMEIPKDARFENVGPYCVCIIHDAIESNRLCYDDDGKMPSHDWIHFYVMDPELKPIVEAEDVEVWAGDEGAATGQGYSILLDVIKEVVNGKITPRELEARIISTMHPSIVNN